MKIVYIHDVASSFSFDDMQYSEDPRLVYANYVEFRPRAPTSVDSNKPSSIFFRSTKSSLRVNKWHTATATAAAPADAQQQQQQQQQQQDGSSGVLLAKGQHRVSFEFRVDIADEDGFLFSTKTNQDDNYFAIVIRDGYIESILSPHRVANADTSAAPRFDRHQRLFTSRRVNDAAWHKLEFTAMGDSVGSFVLDDDRSSKLRFPISYWSDESTLVFGSNADIEQQQQQQRASPSFRGSMRNLVVDGRTVDWSTTVSGSLVNIEVRPFSSFTQHNEAFIQPPAPPDTRLLYTNTSTTTTTGGCVHYAASIGARVSDRETLELWFATGGDRQLLVDSLAGAFVVYTQGPAVVVRAKDEGTFAATIVGTRGLAFNDGAWHKLRVDKFDGKIVVELDGGKHKQEISSVKSAARLLAPFRLGCAALATTGAGEPTSNNKGSV